MAMTPPTTVFALPSPQGKTKTFMKMADIRKNFIEAAQLDWAGFFTFSAEEGTPARDLAHPVERSLALERLREVSEVQDAITARRRDALVGTRQRVLVDTPGVGRTAHECPEIDGIVRVDPSLPVGELAECVVVASHGTDLEAVGA